MKISVLNHGKNEPKKKIVMEIKIKITKDETGVRSTREKSNKKKINKKRAMQTCTPFLRCVLEFFIVERKKERKKKKCIFKFEMMRFE
mmetsp:Transcript_13073/g.18248  ORF Transcript_13073/g.18248 Transcript_13073/m.18248 type:complete len:88 (+) Transcript_13073:392-655(+)